MVDFVPRSGSLPASVNLKGKAFRYQPKKFAFKGQEFSKCFLEGEWKWTSRQRFAGQGFAVGHYVSLAPYTARAELSHYIRPDQQEDYLLLHINASMDNVLDLTKPGNYGIVNEHLRMEDYVGSTKYYIDLLLGAMEARDGGSAVSDVLGYLAIRAGYNGILFPSLRAQSEKTKMALRRHLNPNLYWYSLEEMIRRWDLYNLVVFSGAKLVSNIRNYLFALSYEMNVTKWSDNPLFESDPAQNPYIDDESRLARIARTQWTSLN